MDGGATRSTRHPGYRLIVDAVSRPIPAQVTPSGQPIKYQGLWRASADLTTILVLVMGLGAIAQRLHLSIAIVALWIGALLDGVDGMLARRAGGPTAHGALLDVIADWVAFGLAPVILILTHLPFGSAEWVALTIYLLAALGRLVRSCLSFAAKHGYYIGLPMPAVGGLLLGMVFTLRVVPIPLSAVLVSALAVSWISYPTLGWLRKRRPWLLAGMIILAAAASFLSPWMGLLLVASGYAAWPWLQRMRNAVLPLNSDSACRRDRPPKSGAKTS